MTDIGPVLGVLALQGDFAAHRAALEQAGARVLEVRSRPELDRVDGLVLPGRESTTMLKLLKEEDLFEALQEFGGSRPIFGTCAGAILLASEVMHPHQDSLRLMDIAVERNAYGRQIDSRIATLDFEGEAFETVFIRAPIIRRVGENCRVLLSYQGDPILVEQGLHMAATFHPELNPGSGIHARFAAKVAAHTGLASRNGKQS